MSDYLLPCHHYGDNRPKQREFEVNCFAFVEYVFTLLLLVEHDCFRDLTQDHDTGLHPVGRSKMLWSLIPRENQLVEKYVIERLEKVKAAVISYNPWTSQKTEEILLLTEYYCTGPNIKNTHIGIPSTTSTNGVSLYFSVMEVVENFCLEANIVGITSDGGGNIRVCREALESKYTNDSVFLTQAPIHHGVTCTYIGRGLQGGSAINQVG